MIWPEHGAGPLPERQAAQLPVIRDLDLAIPDGDHLAVVGPSGIGKSTLAGLISGVLRPVRGQVLLGGVALGGLEPGALARRRVLIPQEAYVFSGTLGAAGTVAAVCGSHRPLGRRAFACRRFEI